MTRTKMGEQLQTGFLADCPKLGHLDIVDSNDNRMSYYIHKDTNDCVTLNMNSFGKVKVCNLGGKVPVSAFIRKIFQSWHEYRHDEPWLTVSEYIQILDYRNTPVTWYGNNLWYEIVVKLEYKGKFEYRKVYIAEIPKSNN